MSSTYKDLDEGTSRRLVAAVGGGLLVAGAVLPWTTYDPSVGEGVAGSTAGIAGTAGIAVLAAGLAVLAVALFVYRDGVTVAVAGIAAVVSLGATVPVLLEPTSFAPEVDPTGGNYESAYGLWLAILGALVAGYEAIALGWNGEEDATN